MCQGPCTLVLMEGQGFAYTEREPTERVIIVIVIERKRHDKRMTERRKERDVKKKERDREKCEKIDM